jgi:hypothetical protein
VLTFFAGVENPPVSAKREEDSGAAPGPASGVSAVADVFTTI